MPWAKFNEEQSGGIWMDKCNNRWLKEEGNGEFFLFRVCNFEFSKGGISGYYSLCSVLSNFGVRGGGGEKWGAWCLGTVRGWVLSTVTAIPQAQIVEIVGLCKKIEKFGSFKVFGPGLLRRISSIVGVNQPIKIESNRIDRIGV